MTSTIRQRWAITWRSYQKKYFSGAEAQLAEEPVSVG